MAGLTKQMLKERAIDRLKTFITNYGDEVIDNTKFDFKQFSDTLPKEEHIITHKWGKEPIIVQDICVLSAVMFDDGTIIFCDYNSKENKISNYKHCRVAKNLETSYINATLIDMESKQGVESSVPVRKKPEKINRYKKYGR